eukprot:574733-Amorphochlora_amoeboformis.AAC.1
MTDTDPSLSGAMAPMKQREEDKKGSDVVLMQIIFREIRRVHEQASEEEADAAKDEGKGWKKAQNHQDKDPERLQFDDPAEARYTVSGRLRHANPYMYGSDMSDMFDETPPSIPILSIYRYITFI